VHGDEQVAFAEADIEQLDEIRVLERLEGLEFFQQPFSLAGPGSDRGLDEFDGDDDLIADSNGAKHLAERSLADLVDEQIPGDRLDTLTDASFEILGEEAPLLFGEPVVRAIAGNDE